MNSKISEIADEIETHGDSAVRRELIVSALRAAVETERDACALAALEICTSLRKTAVRRIGKGSPGDHRSARISNLRADVAWRVSEKIRARGQGCDGAAQKELVKITRALLATMPRCDVCGEPATYRGNVVLSADDDPEPYWCDKHAPADRELVVPSDAPPETLERSEQELLAAMFVPGNTNCRKPLQSGRLWRLTRAHDRPTLSPHDETPPNQRHDLSASLR